MESILDWNTKEGMIFRGGSGSGINLSNIRGSMEPLSKGGTASGPVSFMRGADAWAGTIKSGGKTRRAAKMVVLNVDHPDIEDFICCKARRGEEGRARCATPASTCDRRRAASPRSSTRTPTTRSASPTSSCRRSRTARTGTLHARTDGETLKTLAARDLMKQIADAAWQLRRPRRPVRHDDQPLAHLPEHRAGSTPPTRASEYMHVDDSACNLASLNLMKFRREDGSFDVEDFAHAVDVVFLAQEILVGSPATRPSRSAERAAASASSASATPTSARC